jgi:hypothetical protein
VRQLEDEGGRPRGTPLAVSANTSHGPAKARKSPPIAGPTNMPTLAIVCRARFDAVQLLGRLGVCREQGGLGGVEPAGDDRDEAPRARTRRARGRP